MNRLGYENPEVVALYAEREGITVGEAQILFDKTVDWLADRGEAARSPSDEVDAMWHWFILNTEAYAAFCDTHLGGFVHHKPCAKGEKRAEGEALCYDTNCNKYQLLRAAA